MLMEKGFEGLYNFNNIHLHVHITLAHGGKQTRALTIYLRKPILMNFQIASIYKYYISNFSL